jgi:hypothetical protein
MKKSFKNLIFLTLFSSASFTFSASPWDDLYEEEPLTMGNLTGEVCSSLSDSWSYWTDFSARASDAYTLTYDTTGSIVSNGLSYATDTATNTLNGIRQFNGNAIKATNLEALKNYIVNMGAQVKQSTNETLNLILAATYENGSKAIDAAATLATLKDELGAEAVEAAIYSIHQAMVLSQSRLNDTLEAANATLEEGRDALGKIQEKTFNGINTAAGVMYNDLGMTSQFAFTTILSAAMLRALATMPMSASK